jgi:hypothetical protein
LRGETGEFPRDDSESIRVLERAKVLKRCGMTTDGSLVYTAFYEKTPVRESLLLPYVTYPDYTIELPDELQQALGHVRNFLR